MIKNHFKQSESFVSQLFATDKSKKIDEFVRTEVKVKLMKTDWLI